jgi:hypothetical protein
MDVLSKKLCITSFIDSFKGSPGPIVRLRRSPMSFVKLSIFGTSFEVFHIFLPITTTHIDKGHNSLCRSSTSGNGSVVPLNLKSIFHPYNFLGAFGLVWYVHPNVYERSDLHLQ